MYVHQQSCSTWHFMDAPDWTWVVLTWLAWQDHCDAYWSSLLYSAVLFACIAPPWQPPPPPPPPALLFCTVLQALLSAVLLPGHDWRDRVIVHTFPLLNSQQTTATISKVNAMLKPDAIKWKKDMFSATPTVWSWTPKIWFKIERMCNMYVFQYFYFLMSFRPK